MSYFSATIQRYRYLSAQSLLKFSNWLSHQIVDQNNLADPSLMVAECKDAEGNPIAYCTVQPVLLVGTYVLNPTITPEEVLRAGDYLNAAIEGEAQVRGISKCLLTAPRGYKLPRGDKAQIIPVIESPVQQPSNLALSFLNPSQDTISEYVN